MSLMGRQRCSLQGHGAKQGRMEKSTSVPKWKRLEDVSRTKTTRNKASSGSRSGVKLHRSLTGGAGPVT